MESHVMGTDAWNAALVADELPRADRGRRWSARPMQAGKAPWSRRCGASRRGLRRRLFRAWNRPAGRLCRRLVIDGRLQILKIGTDPAWRRRGIARSYLARCLRCPRPGRHHVLARGARFQCRRAGVLRIARHAFHRQAPALLFRPRGRRHHGGPAAGRHGSSAVGGAADAKALRAVTEGAGIQESPVDVASMTLRVDEAHDAQKTAQPAAELGVRSSLPLKARATRRPRLSSTGRATCSPTLWQVRSTSIPASAAWCPRSPAASTSRPSAACATSVWTLRRSAWAWSV